MAKVRRFQNNFTTGEVSPSVAELYNFAKRDNGLSLLKNLQIRAAGGLTRRPGSRFVNEAKTITERVRLVPFVFSRTQAYILEFGGNYIRFYRDNGQLISVGVPVEVGTSWTTSQLFDLDFAQEADTLVITHPTTVPRVLQRFSDTDWSLRDIDFKPPPTEIEDLTSATISMVLALVSGATHTITANAATFAETDVGRLFLEDTNEGVGRAVITEFTSTTVVTAEVTTAFVDSSLAPGEWKLDGSPLGRLNFHFKASGNPLNGNKGDLASIVLYEQDASGAELLTNGTFTAGSITSWADRTNRIISSGTGNATQPAAGKFRLAAGVQAETEGIRPNHFFRYNTSGSPTVASVASFESNTGEEHDVIVFAEGGNVPVATASSTWECRETSLANAPTAGSADGIELNTGPNGIATLQQLQVVNQQSVFEWNITVELDAATLRIGSTSGGSELLASTLLPTGTHRGRFVTPNFDATTTMDIFVQIENNQFNTVTRIREVSVKESKVDGFQFQVQTGDYIRVNNGYIEILSLFSNSRADGVIEKAMDDTQDALSGAWTIEQNQWTVPAVPVYPSTCAFYQGRLFLASGQRVWGSTLTDIRSFAFGILATDAVQFTPAATQVNPIHWIAGEQFLVLGTLGEEFVVSGTETTSITPTDISVASPTAVGSEPIKPQRVNQALLYVKGGGNRIIEFNLESNFQERASRDLSVLASHLIPLGDRITQIAWQEEPFQTLWCVTDLGALFSLTYVREQDVSGWARHDSEDASLYTSVAVIPHPDGDRDQVWFGVRRSDNTTLTDYIEFFDDDGGLYAENPMVTTDSTIRFVSGTPVTTISGLTHLAGRSDIFVVDASGPQGPLTANVLGVIEFAREVTTADVGINYIPELTTLRPGIDGQGPTGLIIGNTNIYASLIGTGDGVFANGKDLKLRRPTDPMDGRIVPVNGEVELPQIGHDRLASINIQQRLPETFEILSIAGTLTVEDL